MVEVDLVLVSLPTKLIQFLQQCDNNMVKVTDNNNKNNLVKVIGIGKRDPCLRLRQLKKDGLS